MDYPRRATGLRVYRYPADFGYSPSGCPVMQWDWSYPRILLFTLVGVVVVTLLIAGSTSSAAFGAYNSAWDGTDDLRSVASEAGSSSQVLLDTAPYETAQPANSTALVIAPVDPYGAQTSRLREFVREGGTLVIADDVASISNTLLADIGASARINGPRLRDEQHYYRSPALPVATNMTNMSILSGVDQLTLNYPTTINPNGATVIARSSEFSYLDRNGNEELDNTETLRERPIVTQESVGEGTVIVTSDASLFINSMLGQPDNRRFTTNLITGNHVLLDFSHTGSQPPLITLLLTIRNSAMLRVLAGLLLVGAVLLGATKLSQRWLAEETAPASQSVTPEELASEIAAEHPEWSASKVRRVATGIMPKGENQGGDEHD